MGIYEIQSLAQVCFVIISGFADVPFSHISNEASISLLIRDGPLPTRPEHAYTRGLSDAMWNLMSQCWQRDPKSRPSMSEIRETIQIHPMRSCG